MKKHVLFVCTGNICRSPMAEGLFRRMVADRPDFEVASAGLAAYPGQAASAHTLSVLKERGIDLAYFRSQPLTKKLAAAATHIFAMTRDHRDAIEEAFPDAADKTYLVTEFNPDPKHMGRDVLDPIGLGREAYLITRESLEQSLPWLRRYIDETFDKHHAGGAPAAAPAASILSPIPTTSLAPETATTATHTMSLTADAPATLPATPAATALGALFLGADHGGVELKDALVAHLKEKGLPFTDLGTQGKGSVDYPDFVPGVVEGVLADPANRGILICTTGIGMSIAANRTPGIQAAVVHDAATARITRHHNAANILCLSGSTTTPEQAREILDAFLATEFDGGRHERRVEKMNRRPRLDQVDKAVSDSIRAELTRQRQNIELIASENFTSRAVMEAQGSCLTNKYAEGYPGKRWYGGCENVDVIEQLALDRLKELFGADHANVQPHSGSQANAAVYYSVLAPGDRILTMNLAHGGHLTHGHPANFSGKFFEVVHYGVSEQDERIDYDALQRQAEEVKPKMITAGASAYPRIIDFERMAAIAKAVGAYLFVDMAHIAGLVAGGAHPSPVPHADFVTTTTHKSLRGPRGGVILCREKYAKKIDAMVFPGTQGGPLMHIIAGKAVCFHEALQPGFKQYQQQVVKNAAALADALTGHGFRIVSGGTDNHLALVDLRPKNLNGKIAQEALDEAGITVNKNAIPFDTASPVRPSGIRIGTPAVTTRGLKEAEMARIAGWIAAALAAPEDTAALHRIREEVRALNAGFPLP